MRHRTGAKVIATIDGMTDHFVVLFAAPPINHPDSPVVNLISTFRRAVNDERDQRYSPGVYSAVTYRMRRGR